MLRSPNYVVAKVISLLFNSILACLIVQLAVCVETSDFYLVSQYLIKLAVFGGVFLQGY